MCVCVCLCAPVCVYIYNYPSFSPHEAYGVGNAECGNSGTTILSATEKTMFRPIACACLWSQIENLWASSSNPKANKYREKEASLLAAHRASTTEKWRWLQELWWTSLDNRQQKYLSRWRSLRALQRSSDGTEYLGSHRPLSLSQNNTSQAAPYLQLKSCRNRSTVTNTAFQFESPCLI